MQATKRKLAEFATRMSALIAIAIALLVPLGYFNANFSALGSEQSTLLDVKRFQVEQVIAGLPELWSYQVARLDDALTDRAHPDEYGHTRVMSADGEVVIEHGTEQAWPVRRESVGLYESGQRVGTLSLDRSYRDLLWETVFIAALGALFAVLVFVVLRAVPLRVLNRVFGELALEKERAVVTLYAIGDGVIVTDARGRIERINPRAQAMTGWSDAAAVGRQVEEVFQLFDDVSGDPIENPLVTVLTLGRVAGAGDEDANGASHSSLRHREGRLVAVEHTASLVTLPSGEPTGGVLVFRDVSKARDLSQRLSWQASHDALTGLLNRVEFERRLNGALSHLHTSGRGFIVLFLDLDRFKAINDTSGHIAGDALLRQVAELLHQQLRSSDVLARLGGDEFAALLHGCPLERARGIAESMLHAVRNFRFVWDDKAFSIGVSIGLIAVDQEGMDAAQIVAAADAACYAAKAAGRDQVAIYESEASEVQQQRAEMDWTLRILRAMDEQRLRLHFQACTPLAEATADAEVYVEVLLRLIDSEGRVTLPGTFLPAAERYHLMPHIDDWVIRETLSEYPRLVARHGPDLVCAINLSGATLDSPGLADAILATVAQHDVPPRGLCFELAETVVINKLRAVTELMRALKPHGFRFALDDFGGGMGSFSYLRNLPVDYLKIDGVFVREVANDPASRVMVEAINRIGHVLGVRTIAEHVENRAISDALRRIGVDLAQGHEHGAPMPLDVLPTEPPPETFKSAPRALR